MPRAVVSQETERFDLTTLPPDGFVELRKLTYGEILKRRDMVSTMREFADDTPMNGNRAERRRQSARRSGVEVNIHFTKIRQFEFSRAVVEHNLEDEAGNVLNLSDLNVLERLDPKVGQEIEDLIADMNNFEGLEEGSEEKTFRGVGDDSYSPQETGSPQDS